MFKNKVEFLYKTKIYLITILSFLSILSYTTTISQAQTCDLDNNNVYNCQMSSNTTTFHQEILEIYPDGDVKVISNQISFNINDSQKVRVSLEQLQSYQIQVYESFDPKSVRAYDNLGHTFLPQISGNKVTVNFNFLEDQNHTGGWLYLESGTYYSYSIEYLAKNISKKKGDYFEFSQKYVLGGGDISNFNLVVKLPYCNFYCGPNLPFQKSQVRYAYPEPIEIQQDNQINLIWYGLSKSNGNVVINYKTDFDFNEPLKLLSVFILGILSKILADYKNINFKSFKDFINRLRKFLWKIPP